MNAVTPDSVSEAVTPAEPADAAAPQPAAARRRPRMSRADREFLPAALEIVEQPPSPVALAFILGICAFAAVALAWAWLGHTDIVAVAYGKVQPTGKVKVVQPMEAGKVRAILVQNGAVVAEGEVLVQLDPDEALAELHAAEAAFVAWTAEALRRADAVAAAGREPVADDPTPWPAAIPAPVRDREDAIRQADLRKLAADLAGLDASAAQKRAEHQRLVNTIAAQTSLLAVQEERVEMRSKLLPSGAGSRSNVIDALEAMGYQRTVLVGLVGQSVEAERALEALAAEREKTLRAFISDNTARGAEARRQADEAEQRLARARVRVERMALRSPIAGTVQSSTVTSLGQVLGAGQEVMRVVPQGATLEVEVYLENKDIGFVAVGQPASVKVEAFPFTRYGIVEATVVRVDRDAIPEPEARLAEGDPARPRQGPDPAGAERVRSLVYPVVLATQADSIVADGRRVPLAPGMAVTAEIKTGQRRILDYLLAPLRETMSQALHER